MTDRLLNLVLSMDFGKVALLDALFIDESAFDAHSDTSSGSRSFFPFKTLNPKFPKCTTHNTKILEMTSSYAT